MGCILHDYFYVVVAISYVHKLRDAFGIRPAITIYIGMRVISGVDVVNTTIAYVFRASRRDVTAQKKHRT